LPAPTRELAHLDAKLVFNRYFRDQLALWGDTETGLGPLFPDVHVEQETASWSVDGTHLMFGELLSRGPRIFDSLSGAAPNGSGDRLHAA